MTSYRRYPTEAQEQTALFRWIAYNRSTYPELGLCFHIPNGGSRNPIEAKNLKAQGTKAGVPDICLPVPRKGYHGLYIEMKRQKGGTVSADQKEWIKALNEQGYLAIVAHGFEEAKEALIGYIRG